MYTPAVKRASKPTVTIIKATKSINSVEKEYRKVRVCAYGRVSTDSEEQMSSIQAQKSYFIDMIYSNPQWEFAGYFEDEGISGRSVKKRLGFQQMIEECKRGKIDLILTKTVSRFSRNLLDSIKYVRALKQLGIEVVFDQDGFRTFEPDAEMRLTIMALFAQEEIIKQSRSVKFGKDEQVRQGNVSYQYRTWYGYIKGLDGNPQIVPEEALIVEQIYSRYLSGESMDKIAASLNEKGIPIRTAKKWSRALIMRILADEKYCGDYVYGKTYKPDPMSNISVPNNGQAPKYHLRGIHDGIITVQTYSITQTEIARRNDIKVKVDGTEKLSKYSSKYALTEKLYCAECKSSMIRRTWMLKDGTTRPVWMCRSRYERNRHLCSSDVIDEYRIHDAIVRALNTHNENSESIIAMVNKNISIAIASDDLGANPHTLKSEITMMEKAFTDLITLSVKSRQPEMFEERFRVLARQIEEKRKLYDELEVKQKSQSEISEKIRLVQDYLASTPAYISEYDDVLVRQTISRIGVMDANYLKMVFVDGTEVIERMMERTR